MMLSPLQSTNKHDFKLLISSNAQLSLCFKLILKGTIFKKSRKREIIFFQYVRTPFNMDIKGRAKFL